MAGWRVFVVDGRRGGSSMISIIVERCGGLESSTKEDSVFVDHRHMEISLNFARGWVHDLWSSLCDVLQYPWSLRRMKERLYSCGNREVGEFFSTEKQMSIQCWKNAHFNLTVSSFWYSATFSFISHIFFSCSRVYNNLLGDLLSSVLNHVNHMYVQCTKPRTIETVNSA